MQQAPNNSSGVGYWVYGTSKPLAYAIVKRTVGEGKLKVELAWQGVVPPSSRHIAVKKNSSYLGYIK